MRTTSPHLAAPLSSRARARPRRAKIAAGLAVASLGFACGSGTQPAAVVPPASTSPSLVEVAALPRGDLLAAAVSDDGTIVVAAEGAELVILDGTALFRGQPPRVLGRASIPASPHALLCDPPHVFVAGGTFGLWRVTLDAGAGASARIATTDGAPVVDVVAIEGHSSGPLVAAVSSAHPSFGVSELLVVDRDPPHALRARVPLVPEVADPRAKALALAVDPGDPATVYVAMGTAGIWRVDLSDLARPRAIPGPTVGLPGGGAATVCDLACARGGARAVLVAAADLGGVVAFDVTDAASFDARARPAHAELPCSFECGGGGVPYAHRVAAAARADGTVLVTASLNAYPAERVEGGPFSPVGRWLFDLELPSLPDAPAGCAPQVVLLRVAAPLAGTAGPLELQRLGSACRPSSSRSVHVVPRGEALGLLEARHDGLYGAAIAAGAWHDAQFMPPPPGWRHAGEGLACGDGVSSELAPGFLYVGVDGMSARTAGVPRFDPDSGTLAYVAHTGLLAADCAPSFCDAPEPATVLPDPWRNGIAGGNPWTDPSDLGREWFAAGKPRISSQCAPDPCAWSDDWCAPLWRQEGAEPLADGRPSGWEIVRLDTHAAGAGGAAMDLRFWSLVSPPDDLGRAGRAYFASTVGPVRQDGERLLHLFRGAQRAGYLVVSAREVVARSLASCGETRGRGQRVETSWVHAVPTHLELDPAEDPGAALTWRGEPFVSETTGSRLELLAIAAGRVVPVPRAPWDAHANRAMVVLYDVTGVGPDVPPRLVRVLLGPRDLPGQAVAVRAAELAGRTWILAADLAGAVHVFDVSTDGAMEGQTFDPADPGTALEAAVSWYAPRDVYDGERANVTDLEFVPGMNGRRLTLVLAQARRGITLLELEIGAGGQPHLREAAGSPIDTPGIASGIIPIRRANTWWMTMGDARCGVRVYRLRP